MKETILSRLVETLPDKPYGGGFVSFGEKETRAIKRAAKKWPDFSLGKLAAQDVRPHTAASGDFSFPISDAEDGFYIREAILGRHYRRGVYRIDADG